jgi:transposase
MLSVSSTTRIFVHALPTDMRKSFDGFYALVVHSFGKDIFQGDYFVFVNRTRDRCKVLFWDRDGLVVWAKRLEQGSFQLPGGRYRRLADDRSRLHDAGDDPGWRGSPDGQAAEAVSAQLISRRARGFPPRPGLPAGTAAVAAPATPEAHRADGAPSTPGC